MGITITKARVIVCEGEGDKAFFSHLIEERGLPEFDIFHPADAPGAAGGVSGFGDFLTAMSVPLSVKAVSGILIVADNDVNPGESFTGVQQQIHSSAGSMQGGSAYGIPAAPLQVAQSVGLPPVVIMMLPWLDTPGNLETICLDAVYSSNPDLRECLDDYCTCSGTSGWDVSKLSKMRLECVIAALCRSKPATALRYAWSRSETIIPLAENCFNPIANFLHGFDALVS
jgi:hypothetical protein